MGRRRNGEEEEEEGRKKIWVVWLQALPPPSMSPR